MKTGNILSSFVVAMALMMAGRMAFALELSSGGVASSDNYTAWVAGTGFTASAYVDVRAVGSSTIIATYSGANRTLTTRNGINIITFRITDATQRSLLAAGGLNLYVVNPSPSAWVGPATIHRSGAALATVDVAGGGVGDIDSLSAFLVGTNFTASSYVDVRPNTTSAVIGNYTGTARTYDLVNGAEILTFRVKDSIQQSLMSRGGLYSWVVSPSTGTFDGPQILLRSNKEQAFGGSNYNWYHVDFNGTDCNREPYGIVKNYNVGTVRSTVQSQLATMRAQGQRRLRVAIVFSPSGSTGTVVQTVNGAFPAQYLTNLGTYLSDIRAAGFEEVLVGMFPLGTYSFWTASTFDTTIANQLWNLIQQARQVVVNANMPYLFDLGNELMPPVGASAVWNQYVTNLWGRYVTAYGMNYTVGFSTPSPDRLSNMGIYGSSKPSVVDVHIYANPTTAYATADTALRNLGLTGTDVVIGEVWYNDSTYAQGIRNSIAASTSGRWVRWLTEWPRSQSGSQTANCTGQNVQSPLDDSVYLLQGF